MVEHRGVQRVGHRQGHRLAVHRQGRISACFGEVDRHLPGPARRRPRPGEMWGKKGRSSWTARPGRRILGGHRLPGDQDLPRRPPSSAWTRSASSSAASVSPARAQSTSPRRAPDQRARRRWPGRTDVCGLAHRASLTLVSPAVDFESLDGGGGAGLARVRSAGWTRAASVAVRPGAAAVRASPAQEPALRRGRTDRVGRRAVPPVPARSTARGRLGAVPGRSERPDRGARRGRDAGDGHRRPRRACGPVGRPARPGSPGPPFSALSSSRITSWFIFASGPGLRVEVDGRRRSPAPARRTPPRTSAARPSSARRSAGSPRRPG